VLAIQTRVHDTKIIPWDQEKKEATDLSMYSIPKIQKRYIKPGSKISQ
jgi:hypothetical protein